MLLRYICLVTSALLGSANAVIAETQLGVEVLFDRAPDDFSEPEGTKFPIDIAQTFANGVIVGGSFEPQIKSATDDVTYNLEGTIGHKWNMTNEISFGGSVGVGRRFDDNSGTNDDFFYYVLRVRADIQLSERWTWNTVNYRYRNAFETSNDYNTPEVATGVSFKLDDSRSISAKYYYSWKDGIAEDQGIGIGYRYNF